LACVSTAAGGPCGVRDSDAVARWPAGPGDDYCADRGAIMRRPHYGDWQVGQTEKKEDLQLVRCGLLRLLQYFSLYGFAAAAIQTAATVSACSQPNTPLIASVLLILREQKV
jgi:hypothetical protein